DRQIERRRVDLIQPRQRHSLDAARQSEDRAAMRHAGEMKPAFAIIVDLVQSRNEARALRHDLAAPDFERLAAPLPPLFFGVEGLAAVAGAGCASRASSAPGDSSAATLLSPPSAGASARPSLRRPR